MTKETKVLVVDDEAGVRRVIRRALEGAGCRVIETEDGAGAAALARTERPDVVFLDIRMPLVDGIAVIEDIRAEAPDAVVVVVSGDPNREALALDRGAHAFLQKPFDLDELRALARV